MWPRLEGSYEIKAGQEIRLTVDAEAAVSMDPVPRFPVNYANFTAMAEVGDTIFIGRYLVRPPAWLCRPAMQSPWLLTTQQTCSAAERASIRPVQRVVRLRP